MLPDMINAALYDQCCVILSTLHYMINAALYDQCCIISSTMHHTANAELHHAMQSCIREFCLTLTLYILHRLGFCWKCEFDTDVKIECNIYSP